MPLSGDRILGRDLALADPAFAALPASLTIAYAPPPGTKRIFARAELARIARANNIKQPDSPPVADEICFEIPLRQLEDTDVLSSMRRSLPADTELTLVELTRVAVPAGSLEFPLTGLEPSVQGTRVWRGYVRYGDTLRMTVRARVTVRRLVEAVVAVTDLAANVPIDASHLRIEAANEPLERDRHLARRLDEVVGRVPKRSVAAGSPIPLSILDIPPTVRRGDAVKVEVRSGSARIQISAIAESAARAGEMVELRNPSSGKTFHARLEADSKAVIEVGAGHTL
jgi:flagella basal body P-ring formation protein FlgA